MLRQVGVIEKRMRRLVEKRGKRKVGKRGPALMESKDVVWRGRGGD